MARLMLSAGMFSALAATMAPRRRGLPSGSPPPPVLAAMVISLMRRVKILPRLASSAPFLCLIVAHFEWPDMNYLVDDLCRLRIAQVKRPCDFSTVRGSISLHHPLPSKLRKVFNPDALGLYFVVLCGYLIAKY